MIIHKEGFKVITPILTILGLLNVILFLVTENSILQYSVLSVSLLVLIFILLFFRDPQTVKSAGEDEILSVSDGTVVAIEPVMEPEYFRDERIQVSVFMSVYNVHINHVPVSGKIVYQKYHPGKFLPAYAAKSSGHNERNSTVIRRHDGIEILVRQIAGIIARRVICYKKEGDVADIKEQLGFIRFGSRVDLFLPATAEIMVKLDQKVKGGVTVIAKV